MAVSALAQAPAEGPLNLLFLLDDQHNPRMLSAAEGGHGGLASPLTPALDELAGAGVRFDNAYCATPQCRPSRFTMLTGRHAHRHGLRTNSVWEPARGEVTLPMLARRFGYAIGTIGKHHMEWLRDVNRGVTDHGFDLVLDHTDYSSYCKAHGVDPWKDAHRHWAMPGLPPALDPVGYTFNTNEFHPAGYFADRAMEFLEERAGPSGDGRPFALWLSFPGPHPPVLPSGPDSPQDWAHMFFPPDALPLPPNFDTVATTTRLATLQASYTHVSIDQHREVLAYYYGLVAQIDHNVGRVLQRLDELGLKERTLVVFTADHGEYASEMGVWTKAGGMHDPVARVPLLLRLPGTLSAGEVSTAPVSHVDLFPTLVELLAFSPTAHERARVDGRSLVDLVTGKARTVPPGLVFAEAGYAPQVPRFRMTASATDKYTFDEEGGGEEEYYDLGADPWEQVNLRADPGVQGRVAELRDALSDWWANEDGHAPMYLPAESVPAPASAPWPPAGATGVPRDADLRWLPATAAASQEVWLGQAPDALELLAALGPMEDTFNPGTLPQAAKVYWRVDGVNADGVRVGPMWSFRTTQGGSGGPGLATNPLPANGAAQVPRDAVLTWTLGAGTRFQELWFGPVDGELQRVLNDLPTLFSSFDPPELLAGRGYRWRVDSIDQNGRTEGDVWTFHVDPAGLPDLASAPSPPHLATGVSLGLDEPLTWRPGAGAVAHDVWFGVEFPLEYRGRRSSAEYAPGPLEPGRAYYWRVDEVSAAGIRTGFTWRFDADE